MGQRCNVDIRTTKHIAWIDSLKGIAIMLVVLGHNSSNAIHDFIYCFHMPLFFILAGFLFSAKPTGVYVKKSLKRFMIPYVSFLIVIILLEAVINIITNHPPLRNTLIINTLKGGACLKSSYGVFWFVTVLFVSLNIFNIICRYKWLPVVIFLCLAIGYLNDFFDVNLYWSIDVVPMALVYIWIGYIIKNGNILTSDEVYVSIRVIIISVLFLSCIYIYKEQLTLDMKYSRYGVPIASLFTSVGASISIATIVIFLSRYAKVSALLAFIGVSSMTIMYIHQPFKIMILSRLGVENIALMMIVILCFSMVIHNLIKKSRVMRFLFLGS